MKKFLEEILLNLKGKVHNYGFWVSLISAIIMLLQTVGVKITNSDEIISSICSIFIFLGIISNPNSGKGFIDKDITDVLKKKEKSSKVETSVKLVDQKVTEITKIVNTSDEVKDSKSSKLEIKGTKDANDTANLQQIVDNNLDNDLSKENLQKASNNVE